MRTVVYTAFTMKFSELKFEPMSNGGNRAVVRFGDYGLSIIDNGYGRERDLYEVGTFYKNKLANLLPSHTGDDTVVGNCTESHVEFVIEAMKTRSLW